MLMSTEELLLEIKTLREENERLKKQLENYNNSKEINKQIERINNEENNELLEFSYLFYDGYEYNLN